MTTRQFLCNHNEKGAGAPAGIKSGFWRSESQDLLNRLAQTMPKTTGRSLADTHSLPDIWGYATFFLAAWEDENHDLHQQAIASWRGLLALVALKEVSELPVTLYSITQDRNKSDFLKAAFLNPPQSLFEPNADTMPLGAILFRNCGEIREDVAGLLLPRLLVLPSREFQFTGHQRIGWATMPTDGTFPLGDPVDPNRTPSVRPALRQHQLDSLLVFLDRLEQNVRDFVVTNAENKRILSTLLNHVTSFLSDVHQTLGVGPQPTETQQYEIRSISDPVRRHASDVLNTKPLQFLRERPIRKETNNQVHESDIAFPFRRNIAARIGATPTPIFYADGMDDLVTAGKRQEDLRVMDDRFVSETNEQDIAAWEDDLRQRDYLLVLPKHIFETHLLELQDTDKTSDIVYQHHGAAANFLLPFKPLILAFLSPKEIIQALRVSKDKDGVTIGIRICLHSPRGDVTVEVSRHYSRLRNEIRQISQNILGTTIHIWPNFHAPDWRIYLLYQNCDIEEKQPMYARRLITEAAIGKALAEGTANGVSSLEAKIDKTAEEGVNRTQLSTNPRKEVIQTGSYIQAVQAAVGNDKGLLLCSQIEQAVAPSITPSKNWRIGIDFGASNSCVAYSAEPYNAPACLLFAQDRTVLLTEKPGSPRNPNNPDYAAAIYEFLSPNRIDPPFLSLLHERHPEHATDEPALLSVNRIGYIDKPIFWLKQLCGFDRSQYVFGLKWDTTPMARSRVKQFIRQLVLQASAEARFQGVNPATIDWRITIPGSLPPNIVSRFESDAKDAVSKVTSKLATDAGGAVSEEVTEEAHPKVKVAFPLESSSVFTYVIAREEHLLGNLQVVMDIGGWSTDMAIHTTGGKMPIWEGSLEIGGQHILVDYWQSEVRTILTYLEDDWSNKIGTEVAEKQPRAIVEMLLNNTEIGDSLFGLAEQDQDQNLSDVRKKLHDLINRTKRRADFTLFALVDYAMYLLNVLVDNNLILRDRRIGFFLCGRGSKLFERTLSQHGPSATPGITTEERLEKFMADVGVPHRVDGVAFTHSPKNEVALGAVILRDPLQATNGTTWRELPLGEAIKAVKDTSAGGQTTDFSASDHLSIVDAASYNNLTCEKLERFSDFIRRYNGSWGESGKERISASAHEHSGLIGTLNSSLLARHHRYAHEAPDDIQGYFQPPFILAVRAALVNWDDISEK